MKRILKALVCLMTLSLVVTGCAEEEINEQEVKNENVKKLQVFDESSNERMVAVMINNNHSSWPHAGLQNAVLVYEIVVEGGITRELAVFKGNMPEKIGSVRSSRPYFIDYALENDAIYVHWGGSKDAYSDLETLKVDRFDGMNGKYFYRDDSSGNAYEHTGFTKGSLIKEGIKANDMRDTTNSKMVFNYSVDEIDLSQMENSIDAKEIEIVYSGYHTTSYKYDEENKVYLRTLSGTDEVDAVTGKQYTVKNIITYQLNNSSYDDYGRQKLDNIGSGEGYYITNGKAIKITWSKSSRSSKTVYKYKDSGEEITLNDGNTYIQIQPKDKELVIK